MEDSCLPQDVLLSKMLSDGSYRTHSETYNLQFWSAINSNQSGKTARAYGLPSVDLIASFLWLNGNLPF